MAKNKYIQCFWFPQERLEANMGFILIGEYQDRRDRSKVNCSKTIWILATNALDEKIKMFCDRNEEMITGEEAMKEMLAKQLSRELKKGFLEKFGVGFIHFLSFCVPRHILKNLENCLAQLARLTFGSLQSQGASPISSPS
jgi:hypothetical protein